MTTVIGNMGLHSPPLWAIMQRQLIELMNDTMEVVLDKYVHPDGSLKWPVSDAYQGIGSLDDTYESFHNWPLFYALGGADKFKASSFRQWEAITRQFEKVNTGFGHPKIVKEYEQAYDWMHQGEGFQFFYGLGLADPERMKERAVRFAGFYMNEDPEAPNYDAGLKLMRSPHVGSMGPRPDNFDQFIPWKDESWKVYYGLPFHDIEGLETIQDIKDPERAYRMGVAMKERMSRGDVPVNLAVTSLVTNAYLYTGDRKYKEWVREYFEAWQARAEANNGLLPDNVGLSGEVGQYLDGKWYGGYYGWTWPHGWRSIGDAVTAASENAVLLWQDPSYMDLLRSQLDILAAKGIEVKGTVHVPYKYGDPGVHEYKLHLKDVLTDRLESSTHLAVNRLLWREGWFEYQPIKPYYLAHLWSMTTDPEDLARLIRLRNHHIRDWERVLALPEKHQGGHDAAWIAYLQGEFPQYPEEILKYNLEQVYKRLDFIRQDRQDPATYDDSYLQRRNPITVEGLVQLTMGAPLPVYNGGLLQARVRYFDLEGRRPGLPPDVGALIDSLDDEHMGLHLVNLSATQARTLVIQAGAYGEHEFTSVQFENRNEDGVSVWKQLEVHAPHLTVRLSPTSQLKLSLGMKRFVREPSYKQPWDKSDRIGS
ncbi:hypothetical protein [Paenibacillus koleovorans]|uniref:hypothetical protein n=1 Tax=Paenibacillus koleovorans TaxID=121608 RepID=UPI000FD837BF|nr:hypothetical protein [Paenibacillus koleovorans]